MIHEPLKIFAMYTILVIGAFSINDIAEENRHFMSYHYAEPVYTPTPDMSVDRQNIAATKTVESHRKEDRKEDEK